MKTCLLLFLSLAAWAQPQPDDPRTRWFREDKFGIFIHWGPYSVIGRHEWARQFFQIPQAEYDVFAKQFNPVNFNADQWVSIAKGAGAKYIVITSKHHDGFSIWRSKASDYDIEITPYQKDPVKLLADAARRQGMRLGFYHSIMDWHHPDYRPRRAWEHPNDSEAERSPTNPSNLRYISFMKEQLKELLTNYGDVAVVWFDGEWEHTLRDNKMDDDVYDFIRKLQPNTLINDRLYERKPGNRADFGTPEQFVPATGVRSPDGKPVLWEACVTINESSWGYNRYETNFKTTRDLIRMLVEVVSKGGNLLLNVGPTPDGRIQDEFVTRLAAMGEWMKANHDSIYGTTASPFEKLPFFGRATVKGDRLFLHVFQWPLNHQLRVPGLKNQIRSASLLANSGSKLTTRRDGDDILVELPPRAPDETVSVVELQLDGAPQVGPYLIRPATDGALELGVESAEIDTRFEQKAKKENFLGHVFLTRWTRPDDIPYWTFTLPRSGKYRAEVVYASALKEPQKLILEAGNQSHELSVPPTGGEFVFKPGSQTVEINLTAGEQRLSIKPLTGLERFNFEKVRLIPIP